LFDFSIFRFSDFSISRFLDFSMFRFLGGADIAVTYERRLEYAALLEHNRLHEFDQQLRAMRRGFGTMVSQRVVVGWLVGWLVGGWWLVVGGGGWRCVAGGSGWWWVMAVWGRVGRW